MKKQDDLNDLLHADVDDLLHAHKPGDGKSRQAKSKNVADTRSKGWKSFFGRNEKADVRPELGLELPHISKNRPPSQLKPELLKEQLAAVAHAPLKLLSQATDYLKVLNQYQAKPELRLKLTEVILVYVGVMAGKLHFYFITQGSGVPEPEDRYKLLTKSMAAIHEVVVSFLQLFKQDLELPPKAFSKVTDRFLFAGVRILELIRIEQRLRALRYQKLPPATWTQCNRIYFVLMEKNLVERNVPLLRCPNFSGGDQSRLPHVLGKESTANQLFISIQLWGLMDALLWRHQFTAAIDAYLQCVESPFQILVDDGRPLQDCWVISYREQSSPPRFDRVGAKDRAAVLMDFSKLHSHLENDHQQLAKLTGNASQKEVPIPLRGVDDYNRFQINQLMRYRLHRHARRGDRAPGDIKRPFRFHFGFNNSVNAFKLVQRPIRPKKEKDRPISAMKWQVVDDSDEGARLMVDQETLLVEPMFIGQLVIYWSFQEATEKLHLQQNQEETEKLQLPEDIAAAAAEEKELLNCPWLERRAKKVNYLRDSTAAGYILRIERLQKRLEMVVIKLSMEADYVRLMDPAKPESDKVYDGLFMTTLNEEWRLVTPNSPIFKPDSPLVMLRDQERIALQLEEICLSTDEFEIFNVSVYT